MIVSLEPEEQNASDDYDQLLQLSLRFHWLNAVRQHLLGQIQRQNDFLCSVASCATRTIGSQR